MDHRAVRASGRCVMNKIGTLAMIGITIALLLLLVAPANAQDVRFHDRAGRVTGSTRTDANGVTTFRDAVGRTTGSARTDFNGTSTLHDAAGRITGEATSRR